MIPEVFSGTLERLTCQLYPMVDDIKTYTVLEAVNSVGPTADMKVYGDSIL